MIDKTIDYSLLKVNILRPFQCRSLYAIHVSPKCYGQTENSSNSFILMGETANFMWRECIFHLLSIRNIFYTRIHVYYDLLMVKEMSDARNTLLKLLTEWRLLPFCQLCVSSTNVLMTSFNEGEGRWANSTV